MGAPIHECGVTPAAVSFAPAARVVADPAGVRVVAAVVVASTSILQYSPTATSLV